MNTPNQDNFNIPDAALAELARGNKVEAIKIIREQTGLGLKEAKDLVDNYSANPGPSAHGSSSDQDNGFASSSDQINMPLEALGELSRGNKIGAIKIIRERHRVGLKEAKDFVEDYIDGNPALKAEMKAAQAKLLKDILKWALTAFIVIVLCVYILASQ